MGLGLLLVFVFGIICFVILIIWVIQYPNLTSDQRSVLRVLLALSAAGVTAVFPGFIEIESELVGTTGVRAIGAMAVFLLVYFISPPALGKEPTGGRDIPKPFGCMKFVLSIFFVCGIAVAGVWLVTGSGFANLSDGLTYGCGTFITKVIPSLNCPLITNKTIYSSNTENFTVTSTHVEFLEDGRMRWHFQFWNQSNKTQTLSFK